MAQIRQPAPTGIDISIQGFQTTLYAQLKALWGLQDAAWSCYDRAYRNQVKDGGYIPEVFVGSGTAQKKSQDYKEVYFDDKVKVTSFFGLGENIKMDGPQATANVFLIFCITDLPALRSGTNRRDEQVRNDVQQVCSIPRNGFEITGIELGIDNVFREYPGWRRTEGIKYRDMHPMHCFRINFNVVFSIYDC